MFFRLVKTSFIFNCIYLIVAIPQPDGFNPEINDQFEKTTTIDDKPYKFLNSNVIDENIEIPDKEIESPRKNNSELSNVQNNVILNFYNKITFSIKTFFNTPKIKTVLTNIGTCIVNGVMEIVSFYLPAPLIPLLASAAGMIIPFEPVVTLRRQMPVTSYRRALKTAVNGFLNTFNVYKFDNEDEDPYMTRRFNRRFMDGPKEDVNISKPFDE
ncbi:uncharacterized protein LOC126778577 [Nymphalis io]|uniref:uncharacterized protein LOC126778577 n=1 Tax=Inachis io TaxID=171585 RepID=UPI002169C3B3|nr:uncharacterized protein LOC126778577 [Nymphalis io]